MQLYVLIFRVHTKWAVWNAIVALSFVALAWTTRSMVLTVQNRVIRLEERLRLAQILPEDLRGRIGELRTGQLIGLRFASDEETPELCRAVLNGELKTSADIKKRIKSWRADTLRA